MRSSAPCCGHPWFGPPRRWGVGWMSPSPRSSRWHLVPKTSCTPSVAPVHSTAGTAPKCRSPRGEAHPHPDARAASTLHWERQKTGEIHSFLSPFVNPATVDGVDARSFGTSDFAPKISRCAPGIGGHPPPFCAGRATAPPAISRQSPRKPGAPLSQIDRPPFTSGAVQPLLALFALQRFRHPGTRVIRSEQCCRDRATLAQSENAADLFLPRHQKTLIFFAPRRNLASSLLISWCPQPHHDSKRECPWLQGYTSE